MQETIKNLTKVFVGESQARNRYTFYAKIAKEEGFEQIAGIFLAIAEQERAHAKRLFEHIQELKASIGAGLDQLTVEIEVPTVYGDTAQNLKAAIAGEHHEYSEMYPQFADTAEREGLSQIAKRLRAIAVSEKHHEERYKKLLKEVEGGTVFKNETEVWWICRECGYVHFGFQPPEKCPSCDHPRGFYQLKCGEC
ncbi:rubrerythrin family protein [Patescibacteria group bacterium]|nr:rubrerythrin family protein [Patescibacteria group bacterium]